MITTANISMQFGSKALFEDISITFNKGNRYGLIGANGSGKSTFMKILSGELEPTEGYVKMDKNERIATLSQDQFAYEEIKIIDCVIMGHKELYDIKIERERIYALSEMSDEDGLKVADLEVEFADMDGYSAESNAGELLLGVGIPVEDHEKTMSVLAPALKLRVLLAQALFGNPEVLLLDEPTNNLDINTIRWLENSLKSSESTMIVISHDRHFLNSVCTHMADLDYGEIRMYPGNYDNFTVASSQARQLLINENEKKKAKIKELKSFVQRFSANASKARQATSRANQIKKIELEDLKKSSRVYPYIRFQKEKKVFNKVLEVKSLSKSYDGIPILKQFSVTIDAGDKLAVIGANGIGKTTLISCVMKDIDPDTGEIKWSENAEIGYFAQNHKHEFKNDLTLVEWMSQWGKPGDDMQTIRGTLGRLLFSQDHIDKSIKVLSGGEQRRMLFGRLILQRPNVIIMDEPTNHLDMESIESLNLALSKFDGTVIFVSHDREFVSSLATRIIELSPNKITEYGTNYDDYLKNIGVE